MNKFLEVSQIINRAEKKEIKRISSREVSAMMGVDHAKLLRKIDFINKDFTEAKIGFSKYWIESAYIDGSGKTNREFSISKRGCDFLANKTTGTKGNLFTNRYIERFEQMEGIIKNNPQMGLELSSQMMNLAQGTQIIGQVVQGLLETVGNIQDYVKDSIQVKDYQIDQVMSLVGFRTKNVRTLGKKLKDVIYDKYGEYVTAKDLRYIEAKEKVFSEFGVCKWEEIPINKYNSVEVFIENIFD